MLPENKKYVNIVAFYLSKFLDDGNEVNSSYKTLGYNSRSEAHRLIASSFGVKSSYVKNMEDNFDSIHSNHRLGWHQRELRPAQKEIAESYESFTKENLLSEIRSLLDKSLNESLVRVKNELSRESWQEANNDKIRIIQKISTLARRGQPRFRANLLKLYRNKCAVTNCKVIELLEAAHISPHSETGINSSENGLLLRSDIHLLYDIGKLKINPHDYIIEISNDIEDPTYRSLNGLKISQNINGEYPSRVYLEKKYLSITN